MSDNNLHSSVVFDFSDAPQPKEKEAEASAAVCTCQTVCYPAGEPSVERPIMVLSDSAEPINGPQRGTFMNPHRRTAFKYTKEGRLIDADILQIDLRFVQLMTYLGEEHVPVMVEGTHTPDGYAVTSFYAVDPTERTSQPSTDDAFIQLLVRRLLASQISEADLEDTDDPGDEEKQYLSDMKHIEQYLRCASNILPANIQRWAHRTVAIAKSNTVSPEERRHAQRALSIMLGIQWKAHYFERIDPVKARQILDEELYGLESVKQRIIETIIQINRTHTLPSYGLLLVGPAGIGKSQIAYAVARILHLPWTSLDMSAIRDPEALTGSPRVYANAKPGRIMESFSKAGASQLVFIINELDKADSATEAGNTGDALLTLLDNLGYTDNYMECMIPTGGVYPIATANDKSRISEPLMTRFALIDIPDYTDEEKQEIFTHFALPRVLQRMGMRPEECILPSEAVRAVVEKYSGKPGCRGLEQAAEHLAAHALYLIETKGIKGVTYDAQMVRDLLLL